MTTTEWTHILEILNRIVMMVVSWAAVWSFFKVRELRAIIAHIDIYKTQETVESLWIYSATLKRMADKSYQYVTADQAVSIINRFELDYEKRLLPLEIDLENRKKSNG